MELTTTKDLTLRQPLGYTERKIIPRQPGSAYTHLAGAVFAIIGAFPLLQRAAATSALSLFSCTVFILGMFLLYSASTLYHTFGRTIRSYTNLKKLDHLMIYVLIAGTYTPVCLIALKDSVGVPLFALVWGIAFIGIFQCLFFIHCPKWVSAVIYIVMGWCCLLAFPQILKSVPTGAFALLLGGGILYTIGGVIYALKLPIFDHKHPNFGLHEIFHCFCLGGSFCHYLFVFLYLA
ncbi:MAG: hemolysin III family protein [Lachnospiraceae bacterium]|nr:hemolysin III family protein [Lachnospiraceae bacterium]